MKVLVTGGAGFIGSNLVDALVKRKNKVLVVDNLSTGKKENLNKKAKFYKLDICSKKILEIFKKEKPEIVCHLAAQINVRKSVEDPLFDAKVNILGSLNLLEASKKTNVKKFIFASTGGALYGETKIIPTPEDHPIWPESPYGICKMTIERYLNYYWRLFKIPFVSLRLGNVYGPRQSPEGEAGVVAIFTQKMLKNEDIFVFGDGKQTRDFIFVEDVVDAFLKSIKKKVSGFFNIGTEKETSVNQIYSFLKKLTKTKSKKIKLPKKKGDLRRSCLKIKKAKEKLNWEPKTPLLEGLKKTVEWFLEKNKMKNL